MAVRFAEAETRGAQAAAFTSMLLIAQQVAGKATRDALFLSNFHSAQLPLAMALAAILSLAAVYWVSGMMVRHAPASVMPWLFAASSVAFSLDWLVGLSAPRVAALLVYFQTALLGPVMISTFWSLINERFDPHTAKRAVSRIAGGGTLGGVLGGVAVWRASSFVQPLTVVILLAVLNALALVGTLLTRARRHAVVAELDLKIASAAESDAVSPLAELRRAPFLRYLALLVALGAAISAILDYTFSALAVESFGKGQALLSFFSLFWLAVGVLSFLLQVSLGRVALEKLGLAVNIAILPGIIVLGGAFGLAVPGLASGSMLRGAEAIQRNTLFRSAYELLYTPISEERKRATKALIDVGFDRVGTVVGSGIALLALGALTHAAPTVLMAAVVALALVTFPVTRKLHVGYVEALQEGLREAEARLKLTGGEDLQRESIPESRRTVQLERERLINQVEKLQPGGLTALLDPSREQEDDVAVAEPSRAAGALLDPGALLARVQDLLSADAKRVTRALESLDARGPSVACAVFLLADAAQHEKALNALRAIAPSITGQLLDALLDTTMDFAVRRRIPRALRTCTTQRAADGLLLGIADERFEVRYECARTLAKITDTNPAIVISPQKVFEAIQREVESGKRIVDRSSSAFDDELDSEAEQELLDGLLQDRANRSLQHMFTILSLLLEREPLRIAFRALHHEDERYRGTALEYLDTILPAELRDIMWPYLGESAPLPTARAAHELLAELSDAAGVGARRPA